MDRRKRFTALLTIGVLLLLTPLVLRFLMPAQAEVGPSTADHFPVQDPKTGRWGFIDKTGAPSSPMVFDWTGDFRHGLGLAELDGAMGYIDETYTDTGNWAIANRFVLRHPGDQPAHGFFDGLALVRDASSGAWGYIDREGKWAIEPRFVESRDYPGVPAGDFSDGLAWFQVVEMDERYKLDAEGNMVRDGEGKPVMQPYPRRRIGYIDLDGEVFIEPRFEMAADFGEGLAGVRDKSQSAWGFIDRAGKRVIAPKFEAVGRFSEGLCAVKHHGKWGYIDKQGGWVIEPAYAEARQFLGGRAAVREGKLWGYIDKKDAWVIRPAFDNFEDYAHPGDPSPFENGLARVTLNGRRVYIDAQGERVWPAE
ncbi:MAG: WG repeat-containing protein [Phycisphaeraceae bacterium]